MIPVRISVVLDASAAVEFSRGSIHVGEVLTMVAEEEAVAVLPLPCLVEAMQWAADKSLLEALVNHPLVAVAGGEPGQWRTLSTLRELVGGYGEAAAALVAIDAGASLLTRWPGLYATVDTGGMVIPIGD